jgi:hypothetical protein
MIRARVAVAGADTQGTLEDCGATQVDRVPLRPHRRPNQDPVDVCLASAPSTAAPSPARPAVLVHSYATSLPVSFAVPFSVRRQEGVLPHRHHRPHPPLRRPWPRVANFQVSISRSFDHHGQKRSYLRALARTPRLHRRLPLLRPRHLAAADAGSPGVMSAAAREQSSRQLSWSRAENN